MSRRRVAGGGALNIVLIAAIFISKFPEGLVSSLGMKSNGKSTKKILLRVLSYEKVYEFAINLTILQDFLRQFLIKLVLLSPYCYILWEFLDMSREEGLKQEVIFQIYREQQRSW
jgi:hypothetical protein